LAEYALRSRLIIVFLIVRVVTAAPKVFLSSLAVGNGSFLLFEPKCRETFWLWLAFCLGPPFYRCNEPRRTLFSLSNSLI